MPASASPPAAVRPHPPLSTDERQALVAWIVGLFEGPLRGPSGFPRAEIGGPDPTADLMHEIGNYASLLAAAGEREYALAQAELAHRRLTEAPRLGGLKTKGAHTGPVGRLLRIAGASHLQDYCEILLGFNQIHEVTRDPRALAWGASLSRLILDTFATDKGLASFWLHGKLPIYEPFNGVVIEFLLDHADLAGDAGVRDRALACLDPFLVSPVFQAVGLWPSWCVFGATRRPLPYRSTRRVDLAKANTSMGFALLRAWRSTQRENYREALMHFVDVGLRRLLAAGGGLRTRGWLRAGGELVLDPFVNSSNHAALELLLDVHHTLGGAATLGFALDLATFWRGQIHPHTGLIADRIGGATSFLDSNTDFAVLFRKIGGITGDASWLEASETLVAAVPRWHRSELGFARATDLSTGTIRDPVIETHYTALYLKPLLITQGADAMRDGWLPSLLRDR